MKERGATISKIAFATGVSRQYLNDALHNCSISSHCAKRVANALCVPLGDIALGGGASAVRGVRIDRAKLITEMARQEMAIEEFSKKASVCMSTIS